LGDVEDEEKYHSLALLNYRKKYCTPLRTAISVPEVKMCAEKWGEIKYERVPSVCMRKSKKLFTKHDGERYQEYLDQVAAGKLFDAALLNHHFRQDYDCIGRIVSARNGRNGIQ
jgi:hypothetical protein